MESDVTYSSLSVSYLWTYVMQNVYKSQTGSAEKRCFRASSPPVQKASGDGLKGGPQSGSWVNPKRIAFAITPGPKSASTRSIMVSNG